MRKIIGIISIFALITFSSASAAQIRLIDIFAATPYGWDIGPIPYSAFDTAIEESFEDVWEAIEALDLAAIAAAVAEAEAEMDAAAAEFCEENPDDSDC